jgi:two-component system LytT family sensor kinase
MKPKDHWLYWTCQVAGWGSYSAIVFAVTTAFLGWQTYIFVGFVLFTLYSIGFTHLLRLQIRKRGWLALPASKGLPRIFGSAITAGALQTLLVVLIARLLKGQNVFDTTAILSTAWGVIFMTCAWMAIYVAVQWYRRYRQAQMREMESQLSLQKAELRALQAQVNPHFLFNSLNTIRGAVGENPEQAQNMITSLSNLFRRSLRSDGAQMIPLAEEMAAVSDYLALESARYEERLRVRLEVDQDVEQFPVPAMMIQTLVENAIKHGISRIPEGGIVSIRGALEKHSLIVEIENTGTLEEPGRHGTHTGLTNTRERLRLLCGSEATLTLVQRSGKVAAKIVIPQNI